MTRYIIHYVENGQTETYFDYLSLPGFAKDAFNMMARLQSTAVFTGRHLFHQIRS